MAVAKHVFESRESCDCLVLSEGNEQIRELVLWYFELLNRLAQSDEDGMSRHTGIALLQLGFPFIEQKQRLLLVAYFIAKRVCIALQKKDREIVLHGYESGRIVKLPGGEFIEVHQPLDEYDRWRLVSFTTYEPLMIRPNSRGKITIGQRMRAGLSRWFFEDRIAPVTKGELEAAHHSSHH